MSSPAVSVIMPVHNGARHLAEAIRSVMTQDLSDWELLVVDDGSTDRTAAIASGFGDRRLRYLYQPQRGPSAARNAGASRAAGAYLCFLDADDMFDATKLRVQVAHLEATPQIGLNYGSHIEIDPAGRRLQLVCGPPEVDVKAVAGGWPFDVDDFIVRRHWFEQVGGFDERVRVNEDRDLFLRLGLAGCAMRAAPMCLSYRRLSPGRSLPDRRAKLATALVVLRRALRDPRCPEEAAATRKTARAALYLTWAYEAFSQEATRDAQRHLRTSVGLDPSLLEGRALKLLLFIIDASIRDGGQHHAHVVKVLRNLPPELAWVAEHEGWAVGAGYLRAGTRDVLWGRTGAGAEKLASAAATGAVPDTLYLREAAASLLNYEHEFGARAARQALGGLCRALRSAWNAGHASELRGHFLMARAFDHHQRGRHAQVPGAVIRAVIETPSCLRNRGLMAICVRSAAKVLRAGAGHRVPAAAPASQVR